MFERFTTDAREVVVGAQEQARELRPDRVGTEHLLLSPLAQFGTTASTALGRHGLTPTEAVADVVLATRVLRDRGVDLSALQDEVRVALSS